MQKRLKDKPVSRKASKRPEEKKEGNIPESEESLFRQAMEGVKPISKSRTVGKIGSVLPKEIPSDEEGEPLRHLKALIRYGKGFVVADTPEYIEGTGYNIHGEFAKRLHRGDFSIQGFIDLHGLSAVEAEEAFNAYLQESIKTGKRVVLIVHGRGLSSPGKPVLKSKVKAWLDSGIWRRWIIAYASARACDGGAGATYVLLRHRAVTKIRRGKRP